MEVKNMARIKVPETRTEFFEGMGDFQKTILLYNHEKLKKLKANVIKEFRAPKGGITFQCVAKHVEAKYSIEKMTEKVYGKQKDSGISMEIPDKYELTKPFKKVEKIE